MKLPLFRAARARLATSADVEAEAERHRGLLAEARASLAQLDLARHEVMIGDDAAAIRAHLAAEAEVRMAVERLDARLAALAATAEEVAEREAAAALDSRRKAVEARAAEAAAWLRDAYPKAARELVDALAALHEVEGDVAAVNIAMAEGGRADVEPIPGVQDRLRILLGDSEGMDAGSGLCAGTVVSLGSTVRLPHLTGGVTAPGWSAPAWS